MSCLEEVLGAACPLGPVAEVAVRVEGMLASGVEDVKSPVAQVEGWASGPGAACHFGSSSSVEPGQLAAPGLELGPELGLELVPVD